LFNAVFAAKFKSKPLEILFFSSATAQAQSTKQAFIATTFSKKLRTYPTNYQP